MFDTMRRASGLRAIAAMLACSTACFDQPPASSDDGSGSGTSSADPTVATGNDGADTTGGCEACPDGSACVEGTCVPMGCGDGIVDEGEACDEGPANAQSGSCKL